MVRGGRQGQQRLIRTFVAIEIPKPVIDLCITTLQKESWDEAEIRWMEPENVHLTIHFTGNVEWIEIGAIGKTLIEVCSSIKSFDFQIRSFSAFPTKNRPRVLTALVEPGEEIMNLNRQLSNILQDKHQIRVENRRYTPHVTLGRIRKVENIETGNQMLDKLKGIDVGLIPVMSADSVVFFQSKLEKRSAEYSRLSTAYLTDQ